MGGKNKAPPAPNYAPIYQMQAQQAAQSFELSQKQWDYFVQKDIKNTAVSDQVIEMALGRLEREDLNAQKDRERYETIFQPLEEQLAYDAESYSSPWRIEQEAGKAEANIAQQFEQARDAATQQLERTGVNPSDARTGALDRQARIAEAAAQSAAGNQARDRTEAIGRQLRSEAINVGKGYPAQIQGGYGTSAAGGQQAAGTGLATTASAANTMGTPMGWQAAGTGNLNAWGSLMNNAYSNQLKAYEIESSQDSGWGDVAGMVAGMGFKALTGGFGRTGGPVSHMYADGGAIPMYQDGGPQDVTTGMGGNVPHGLSPSGGAIPDDIPATVMDGGQPKGEARINAGEFIIPKDVTEWKGQEYFQKEIMKARKQMSDPNTAPAQPTMAPPGAPEMMDNIPTGAPPQGPPAIPTPAMG